jgi:glycosyltransferase involved in cell wall biosynthesis
VIGISLLTLVPGEMGGSESATRGLLRALAQVGTLPYRVYLPPAARDAHEGLPYEIVTTYREAHTRLVRLAALAAATVRPEPLRLRMRSADVVHYPFTIRVPALESPSVVTVHDLQHLDLPQLFSRAERAFRAVYYHRAARAAARVVVPSEFVRDGVARHLDVEIARIRVVAHGLDHEVFSPGHDAREPFLLYPARAWPHKNHVRLFEAFALLRREQPELRLVLTGGGHGGAAPDGVEVRGHVSLDELVSLYRRAGAVVFPSLYEGFGQPVLEAMACGCAVACSNVPALVEVAGDAARTFAPDNAEAIAEAVRDVLREPELYRERGLARAAAFTWERAARSYEDVYRELL